MLTGLLLFVHLFGLIGAAGGIASGLIMRRAAGASGEQAIALRGLGPMLARLSTIGLVLMWLTGPALVQFRYGGFAAMPALFWVKFVFVLSLTLAAIALELTYAAVKRGDVNAAKRLPMFGPIAGASSVLAVLFAALAFH